MARPKAFDNDKVLTAAMLCFWHRGYTATSMKDLESATGLTPSSLYNSFGSKDGLFLKSVDHYIEIVVRKRIAKFLESGDPILGIKQFIKDCFENRTGASNLGCLLTNTSTELGPHDDAVRKKVSYGMRLVEKALVNAITHAQSNGQLNTNVNSAQMATHLGLLMNGMLVNAKVAKNTAWLDSAMHSVDHVLR